MIVSNAGILTDDGDICDHPDLSRGLSAFNINSLGPLRMVDIFLPLMDSGLKRLCFVSSEAGSISVCMRDRGPVTYCMSKTALNMGVRILHNRLAGEGYTFRLYHPGWLRTYMNGEKNMEAHLEPEESAASAVSYFTGHLDSEERLQVVDNEGAVWPF